MRTENVSYREVLAEETEGRRHHATQDRKGLHLTAPGHKGHQPSPKVALWSRAPPRMPSRQRQEPKRLAFCLFPPVSFNILNTVPITLNPHESTRVPRVRILVGHQGALASPLSHEPNK